MALKTFHGQIGKVSKSFRKIVVLSRTKPNI